MSSVHFRSRIKPAFDYSDALNGYGVCCNIGGSGGNLSEPLITSFYECWVYGGIYIPVPDGNYENVSCPQIDNDEGCCCACKFMTSAAQQQMPTLTSPNGDPVAGSSPYLSPSTDPQTDPNAISGDGPGLRSFTSKCYCESIGGKWTPGNCPNILSEDTTSPYYWKNYCMIGATLDARAGRACCHLSYNEYGEPSSVVCTDVCNPSDCGALSQSAYVSIYNSSTRCNVPLIEGTPVANCSTNSSLRRMVNIPSVYDEFDLGSCYSLVENGITLEYECTITPKSLCTGYWVEVEDSDNPYCGISGETYRPSDPVKNTFGKYVVQEMGLSAFNALGLTSGDIFQGGIYIGIFEPPYLNGKSSLVYGNLSFGSPTLNTVNADSIGGTGAKWAIIVDSNRYSAPFLFKGEQDLSYQTSLWDGYYNTYGSNSFSGINTAVTNTIRYADRKGFIDFYIPSIYELYFYSAYLKSKNIENLGTLTSSSLFDTKYLNSKTKKNKSLAKSFVYGVAVDSSYSINYKTVLIDKKTPATMMFFRRILLT